MIIKPDVILVWPKHVDYPLFRYTLEQMRPYLNKVYIAMSDHHDKRDYTAFLKDALPFAQFVVPQTKYDDWRQNGVREILDNHSTADYVMFLEQDFLIRDERLFEIVLNDPVTDYNCYTYMETDRVHPCFAVVKRELIEKTSKDFGAMPPNYDHFGKFFREVVPGASNVEITTLELKPGIDFYHMAGLTNNYDRFGQGMDLYKPEEFLTYNGLIHTLPVVQHGEFMETCIKIVEKYGLGEENSFIKEFFPEEKK